MALGSMVGRGYVQITPSMRGFRREVDREVDGAAQSGSRRFSDRFRRTGSDSGRKLGQSMSSTFQQSAGRLGEASMRSLRDEVAKSTRALSTARLKQQDEAGRVRVAEARLAEAVKKGGAESARAIAAEERLASARRKHEVATDAVKSASDRLKTAQDALRSATEQATVSATRSGTSLGQMGRNFLAGARDSKAAASDVTGLSGALGGLTRAVARVTGFERLGRLARTSAQQVYSRFTSLASQVGGSVSRVWQSASGWLSRVGSTVRARLSPVQSVLSSFATRIASPFQQLGTRISGFLSPVTSAVRNVWGKLPMPTGAVGSIVSTFGNGMRRLGGAASDAIANVSRIFATGLRNIATGVVAAGAAAISTALVSGTRRLSSIDEALARMRGAGFASADITRAMEQADEAATGTAFALNDMANAAALAMTNGIKPGQQLERHLNAVRGVAAASNAPLNEISTIWGKLVQNVQSGSAITTEMQQMADRQIPIWNKLSEVMGVPIDQVKELASQGAISMDELYQATEAAAGGMADAMGTTLTSKIKNTFSALGRLGQAFLGTRLEGDELTGGLFPAFKGFFDMLREGINLVTALITPFFQKWTDLAGSGMADFFAGLAEKFVSLREAVQSGAGIGDGLQSILSVVGPLGGALTALGAGGLASVLSRIPMLSALLPGLGKGLGLLGGPIGIIAAAIGGLLLTGGDLGAVADGVGSMVDGIVAAIPQAVAAITGFIPVIIDGIVSALPGLIDAALQIVNALVAGLIEAVPALLLGVQQLSVALIDGIVSAIPMLVDGALALALGLVDGLVAAIPLLIDGAINLVLGLVDGLITAIPMLIDGALQLVQGLVTGLIGALPLIIQGALSLVQGLTQALVTNLPLLIDAAITLVTSLVQGLVDALPLLIEAALELVMGLTTALVDNLPLIIQGGIDLLLGLVTGLIGALPELIPAALDMVFTIVNALIENLPLILQAGIEILIALIGGLLGAIPDLIAAIPEIVAAIWDTLTAIDWLQLGKDIIQGLIDGIVSMATAVWDAIKGLLGGLADFFPHSPAKKGPLSGRGYPGHSGAEMVDDFAESMESRQGRVERAARAAAEAASFTAEARYGVVAGGGVPGRAVSDAPTVQQTFHVPEGYSAAEIGEFSAWTVGTTLRRVT